ncbi:MAG: Rho termination factor N-terminal domain-containing protein [Clostridia bacterium]|nr:Rho termination factor N-terminal domain-containing protein [Clostridia bacterium]
MKFNINNFDEKNLQQMGIFQLRTIAREVGVHLPTTLKKQELIEQILKVARGEVKPFVPKNKKGRPPKTLLNENSSWAMQEEQNLTQEENSSWQKGKWLKSKFIDVKVDRISEPESINFDEKSAVKFSGILFCEPNGNGTVHIGGISKLEKDELAFLTNNMILQYGLKTGDEITGCYINTVSGNLVVKLDCINGKTAECFGRKDFDSLKSISTTDKIDLSVIEELKYANYLSPIGKGQRVLVRGCKGSGKSKFLFNLAKSFALNGIKTIYLVLDKRPEDNKYYEIENLEYCFASFDVIPFKQMYIVELALSMVKRMCEEGKDVALVVDDIFAVARAYDGCLENKFNNSFMGLDTSTTVAVKKVLAVGRNIENCGSVTFVGCVNDNIGENDIRFVYQLDDLCNCHIKLADTFNKVNLKNLVLPSSFTENASDLLSTEEQTIANSLKIKCENKTEDELKEILI